MGFFEILLFIVAGQYIHVLIKMKNAKKKFGARFSAGKFFSDNALTLVINGSLILIASVMLTKAGFGEAITAAIATARALNILGLELPAKFWISLSCYSAFLTAGYFIQSLFYWLMKGGLKKANVEAIDEERLGV